MARKPSSRRHKGDELEDVNLVPIMSILVILIPMLIYAFTFFEVTVQSVAAPKMGTGKAKTKDDEPEKKPLNLTVLISDDGFMLKYDDEMMGGEAEKPIKRIEFPADVDHGNLPYWEYDYPALHNRLARMKERFPSEEQINIGAEMHIPWHTVARTIDAARLQLLGVPFEGEERMAEYRKAKPVKVKTKGEEEPQLLFPNVVFVVAE